MGSRGSFKSFLTKNNHRYACRALSGQHLSGHGDSKKCLEALYLNISDEDLLAAMDNMKFDRRETDTRVKK